MFICNGKLEWNWEKKVKALDPSDFRALINRAPAFREGVIKKRSEKGENDHSEVSQAELTSSSANYDGLLMDESEVGAFTDAGIEVAISRVKGLASNARELQQTIFQISVANVGLMQVQCVDVIEDCCTYEVQKWLDKGWRIIAVCPPNDTRRPSYVMGHFEKEPHR